MKNKIRSFGVNFLIIAYCFVIASFNKVPQFSGISNSPDSLQESVFVEFSANLYCSFSKFENSVDNINNFFSQNFKIPFLQFDAIFKYAENFLETEFTQYTSFSGDILIKHRKSDIIFPFHYFW